MRPPILIAFALLLAACGVKLDLDQHPGECAIILIRHEVEADGNNPLWADEMGALLAGIRSRLVPYRSSLMLGDVRGKILLLSRDSFRGGALWCIHPWLVFGEEPVRTESRPPCR